MFRHYRVILRELIVSTLLSYTSLSNAAVDNTIYNLKISHRFYASSQYICSNLIFHKRLRFTQTKRGAYFDRLNEVFYIDWLLYC